MSDLGQVHKVLDSGYSNVPMPQDTEKWVLAYERDILSSKFHLDRNITRHETHTRHRRTTLNHSYLC